MQRQGAWRCGRLGAARARCTAPAVLLTKAHLDVSGACGIHPLGPTRRRFALWTVHLLALPIHGKVGQGIRPLNFRLPVGIRARWAPQCDALLIVAADEQCGGDLGRVDNGSARSHLRVEEGLLNGGRALRLMDGGRRRVDVREEVRGSGLARFADVHHVAGPLGLTFVAVACLGIVRRFDPLGGRGQCTVCLEADAMDGASFCPSRLVPYAGIVALPRPT